MDIIIPFFFVDDKPESLEGTDFLFVFKEDFKTIKKVYSKTTQTKYYANVCPHCNRFFGDFFLSEEALEYIYNLDYYDPIKVIQINSNHEIYDNVIRLFQVNKTLCLLCGKHVPIQNKKSKEEIGFQFDLCEECYSNLYEKKDITNCEICNIKFEGKSPRSSSKAIHHLRYFPPETIAICRKCHLKIHSNDSSLKDFEPDRTFVQWKTRPKPKYKNVSCANNCGHKKRVQIDDYDPNKKYFCNYCLKKIADSFSEFILVPCVRNCGHKKRIKRNEHEEGKQYLCSKCEIQQERERKRFKRKKERKKYINKMRTENKSIYNKIIKNTRLYYKNKKRIDVEKAKKKNKKLF